MEGYVSLFASQPIPKDLYSINPRLIEPSWWHGQRQWAMDNNKNLCGVCGAKAKEGHETYIYDFPFAVYAGVVPVCKDCHAFVHLNLQYQAWLRLNTVSYEDLLRVSRRGVRMCIDHNVVPNSKILHTLTRIWSPRMEDEVTKFLTDNTDQPPGLPWLYNSPNWRLYFHDNVYQGGLIRTRKRDGTFARKFEITINGFTDSNSKGDSK